MLLEYSPDRELRRVRACTPRIVPICAMFLIFRVVCARYLLGRIRISTLPFCRCKILYAMYELTHLIGGIEIMHLLSDMRGHR
jgi:hypothetical protein